MVYDLDLRVVCQTEGTGRLAMESRRKSAVELSDASSRLGSAEGWKLEKSKAQQVSKRGSHLMAPV